VSSAIGRILNTLIAPLRAVARHLRALVQMLHAHAPRAWVRHTDRLEEDRSYRRTLVTAVTALATTLVPHPVIAAALGVWITETPRSPHPAPVYDPDADDDGPPPWRPRPTLWNTFGQ
jgi:hypothetical protein